MSSKLPGILVIGCIIAGVAISGRHRPDPHHDATVVAETIETPVELSEQSDYFQRPERPRSPAAMARSREAAAGEASLAPDSDPLATTTATNLPRLESKYASLEAPRDKVKRDAVKRDSLARTDGIAEPSSEVRLVSGTAPARPRFRVRTADATENTEKAGETSSSPPLRPSRPAVADEPREDQPRKLTHHTIRDGDTLESIAEVRLGSARRWRELFDLNRDVLSDPAYLPVGAKLRLSREPRKIASVHQGDANELEPIGAWKK
jgi:nucleoid-associated protein YgaU